MRCKPEAQVLSEVLHYLAPLPGVYAWRNNSGALYDKTGRLVRFGCPGSADILGLTTGGRLLAVECKAADGQQSPGQRAWGARIQRLGGIYVVARDVETVRRVLNAESGR